MNENYNKQEVSNQNGNNAFINNGVQQTNIYANRPDIYNVLKSREFEYYLSIACYFAGLLFYLTYLYTDNGIYKSFFNISVLSGIIITMRYVFFKSYHLYLYPDDGYFIDRGKDIKIDFTKIISFEDVVMTYKVADNFYKVVFFKKNDIEDFELSVKSALEKNQ
jgi:hypothetical protein